MPNSEDNTRTISTAEFTQTPRIALEQATGDVNIEGWDRPEVQVSTDDDLPIAIEQNGSQIVIRSRPPREQVHRFEGPDPDEFRHRGRRGFEGLASQVERQVERSMRRMGRRIQAEMEIGRWAGGRDFTIKVPHRCDISLRSSTGDITIASVQGALYIQTASGDLNLENITGPSIVHSASGDVSIDGINGKLGVHAASGDVRIDQANLEELIINSASGDVQLEMMRVPQKGFDIKTVSGDLDVELPGDARLTIQASTFSGDFHCSLPHERSQKGPGRGREQMITINGGGPLARFNTLSGDVDVGGSKRLSDDAPPLETTEPEKSAAGEPTMDLSRERAPQTDGKQGDQSGDRTEPEGYAARKQAELEILQAVERGDLSAQDAVKHLSELDKS